jgi:hypothetical protein
MTNELAHIPIYLKDNASGDSCVWINWSEDAEMNLRWTTVNWKHI